MSSKTRLLKRLGGLLTYRELREFVLGIAEYDRRRKALKNARCKPSRTK